MRCLLLVKVSMRRETLVVSRGLSGKNRKLKVYEKAETLKS